MSFKKIFLIGAFLSILILPFLINVPSAKAITVEEIRAKIVELQAQIAELQKQLVAITGEVVVWCHDFNVNLRYGDSGGEVKALQTALTKEGFNVSGDEAGNFGEYTASAVVGFQEKYKDEILAPWGLKHGTGFVGKTTRAKLNKLYGCVEIEKPSLTVLSPNGGEVWQTGKTYDITWKAEGVKYVDIYINSPYTVMCGRRNEGNTWVLTAYTACEQTCNERVIAKNVLASAGKYSWTIPADQIPNTYSLISVKSSTSETICLGDSSDNVFSIVSSITLKNIENQLASLAQAINQLAEKIKALLGR